MSESVFLTTSRVILPIFLLILENYEEMTMCHA